MELTLTKEKGEVVKHISDLQNSYIYYLNHTLERLHRENQALSEKVNTLIQEKDSMHSNNNALSAENSSLKDEIRTLNAEKQKLSIKLADVTKQSGSLEDKYRSLNEKHQVISSKLTATEETNNQLQSRNAALQQKLADMENSRSWKLTRPLRAIKWWLCRIFGKRKAQ